MKKKKYILYIVLNLIIQNYCMGQNPEQEVLKIRDYYKDFNYIPDSGFINNKDLALKLANIILESAYGESIKNVTLEAYLIDNNSTWAIIGRRPKGAKGGTPYVEIRRKDGLILKVANSK